MFASKVRSIPQLRVGFKFRTGPPFVRGPSQLLDEMPLYNFKLKCVLVNVLNLRVQVGSAATLIVF